MSTGVIASQETASSPSVTADGVSILRAALYVDGFNLYHAIDDLDRPFLKWLDLWALGERILDRKTERLVRKVYCTAQKPGEPAKNQRHAASRRAIPTSCLYP